MPLVRILVSTRLSAGTLVRDAFVNTFYFNVSGSVDEPNYTSLVNDFYAIWAAKQWATGRFVDVRAYNMDDPEPRPQRAIKTGTVAGTAGSGPTQVALALSYFADRNLPRQRGRVFIGPWNFSTDGSGIRPTLVQQQAVMSLATDLAGLGGLNVDWSLWSPTTSTHTRISNVWVDNAWDTIRSRRLRGTSRLEATING